MYDISCNSNEFVFYRTKKIFTQFVLEDSNGDALYYADYKLTALKKQYIITDANDNTVGKIIQCISPIVPKFKVILGEKIFFVKRKICLHPLYVCRNIDCKIEGDVSGFNYIAVNKLDDWIFKLKKEQKVWNEKHYLNIQNSDDVLTSVCIALTVHLINKTIK